MGAGSVFGTMERAVPPEYPDLTPEKALIFRITHRDNIPWILDHGLHCASSPTKDLHFVVIGKQDLIGARGSRRVPAPPGGTLADYVPFYFAPRTPMLHNIQTGEGVRKRKKSEIVFIVSSLHELARFHVSFVFTDRHAAAAIKIARFSSSLEELHDWLPWADLRAKNFRRDPDDPDPFERYQAEALAHRHVPREAIQGIACYDQNVKLWLDGEIAMRELTLQTHVRAGWYIP